MGQTKVAQEWIQTAGKALYKESVSGIQLSDDIGRMLAAGPRFKGNFGFSPARWNFWKDRFWDAALELHGADAVTPGNPDKEGQFDDDAKNLELEDADRSLLLLRTLEYMAKVDNTLEDFHRRRDEFKTASQGA